MRGTIPPFPPLPPPERPSFVALSIAGALLAVAIGALALALLGCAAPPASGPHELDPGFTAFCAAHPHQGICP